MRVSAQLHMPTSVHTREIMRTVESESAIFVPVDMDMLEVRIHTYIYIYIKVDTCYEGFGTPRKSQNQRCIVDPFPRKNKHTSEQTHYHELDGAWML